MLLQVISDLEVFTQIHVLRRAGAPTRDTSLLGTRIYSYAKELSPAGAPATLVLVLVLVLALALTGACIWRMLTEDEL